MGVRDGVLDMFQVKNRTPAKLNSITLGLLAAVTGLAFVIKDLRIVLALGGATWGNAVVYLFPTFMFASLAATAMPSLQKEAKYARAIGLTGLAMGIIGTMRAIKSMKA